MKPTLLILAAGMGSRYGGLKQIDPVGVSGEAIIEYSIYDAIKAGFDKVVFVIRRDFEALFKEKIGGKFEKKIKVEYAFQDLDAFIPSDLEIPEERTKPWGTGHAVLVAKEIINEPFAVINADDYYGITAYEKIAKFLMDEALPDRHSMVGYVLSNTLSDHGTVNRGVCKVDDNGNLVEVIERYRLKRNNGNVEFYDEHDEKGQTPLDSVVSMNFWGFHPSIFDVYESMFEEFIRTKINVEKSEFLIPEVVFDQIQTNQATYKVITCEDKWYGVTYKADKDPVQQAFAEMTNQGVYPSPLW
ncbi:MAG: nucleotidyltransferase [Bacteroidia bacterium]|nr:nucleotidyltransferase [Bacteroidia bacterium]